MTDNTAAVEKLAGILQEDERSPLYEEYANIVAGIILAEFQRNPLAYVKPKPLEWVDQENPFNNYKFLRADTSMGWYEIHGTTWSYNSGGSGNPPTLEAAQAAAYEDLCNRVKELF